MEKPIWIKVKGVFFDMPDEEDRKIAELIGKKEPAPEKVYEDMFLRIDTICSFNRAYATGNITTVSTLNGERFMIQLNVDLLAALLDQNEHKIIVFLDPNERPIQQQS